MYRSPPILRQDKGLERRATWLELFFDLVFVVSISQLSEKLVHNLTWRGSLEFIILFIPIWWIWAIHTLYLTRFDIDNAVNLIGTFVVMFAAAIMTVQIPVALGTGANGFGLGFILAGLIMLFFYARIIYYFPQLKRMLMLLLNGFGLGIFCWVLSIFMPIPIKFYLWCLGMFIVLIRPWIGRKILYELPPFHSKHTPERFGLFTIIVLGETIAGVILGLNRAHWSLVAFVFGMAGFILAILIWLQYYTHLRTADYLCNLRLLFVYAHLPLAISLVLLGVAIEAEMVSITQISQKNIHTYLYLGSILWLSSFYLVQTSSRNNKPKLSYYSSAIITLFAIFYFLPLNSLEIILIIDIIFAVLIITSHNVHTKWLLNAPSKNQS